MRSFLFAITRADRVQVSKIKTRNNIKPFRVFIMRRTRLARIATQSACFAAKPLARSLKICHRHILLTLARIEFKSRRYLKSDTRTSRVSLFKWCGGRDLNSYGVTHRLLRPARLPISPPPQTLKLYIVCAALSSKAQAFFVRVAKTPSVLLRACRYSHCR